MNSVTTNSVSSHIIASRQVCLKSVVRSAIPRRISNGQRFVFTRAGTEESVTNKAEKAASDAEGAVKDTAKPILEQAEDAFQQQAKQVDNTVKEPLSKGKPATDPSNAWDESIKEAGKAETEKLGTEISVPDALRFRGVGPEHINSRLAMIGVTTGYLTKLITGKNTLDQYIAAPLPVILTFILFITASLIPITKGVTPDKAENGIWTAKAEIYNGRLAMLGFISLLATDGWQWFSALQAAKGASLSQ